MECREDNLFSLLPLLYSGHTPKLLIKTTYFKRKHLCVWLDSQCLGVLGKGTPYQKDFKVYTKVTSWNNQEPSFKTKQKCFGGMNSSAKLEEPAENTKAMVGKEMHIEPHKAEAWGLCCPQSCIICKQQDSLSEQQKCKLWSRACLRWCEVTERGNLLSWGTAAFGIHL